jgi:hypothetical protein
MASTVVSKTVILDTPTDWKPWFYVIKAMSANVERDVWEYINPELPTEPSYHSVLISHRFRYSKSKVL